jgi:hypothetical protein
MTLVMNLLGIVFVLFGLFAVSVFVGYTVIAMTYEDNPELAIKLLNLWAVTFGITKEKV